MPQSRRFSHTRQGRAAAAAGRHDVGPGLLVSWATALAVVVLAACAGGSSPDSTMDDQRLQDFATRYTAAWSNHDAAGVASFFSEQGSLTINGGAPAVGREAIAAAAQGFMTAFPDALLEMDSLRADGETIEYHWTFSGTNTGPGGTGNRVRFSGFEAWTFDAAGLVRQSLGHFDEAEYQRQVARGVDVP